MSIYSISAPQTEIEKREEINFIGDFTEQGVLDIHTVEWDFGDDTTESETLTPLHSYSYKGTYVITLTVTDDDGGTGTGSIEITVSDSGEIGDANGDGAINVLDITRVAGIILELDLPTPGADLQPR